MSKAQDSQNEMMVMGIIIGVVLTEIIHWIITKLN